MKASMMRLKPKYFGPIMWKRVNGEDPDAWKNGRWLKKEPIGNKVAEYYWPQLWEPKKTATHKSNYCTPDHKEPEANDQYQKTIKEQ